MKRLRLFVFTLALLSSAWILTAAEEHVRGVLEKTAKDGAAAQITDALNEIYYVVKTPEAEASCKELMGKRVVLTGTVEQKSGDPAYYFNLKQASLYQPKLPQATKPAAPAQSSEVPVPAPPKEEKSAPAQDVPKVESSKPAEPAKDDKTKDAPKEDKK